jgi:transposase
MTLRIELNEAERLTLEELSQHHPFWDIRRRALGLLALAAGERASTVALVLGVTLQSPRNWKVWWRDVGLMGLLGGHQGGRPPKLTAELLITVAEAAHREPLTLREIADAVRDTHPTAPEFSLARLAAGLKRQGLSWKRCRLSLKKKRPDSLRDRPR